MAKYRILKQSFPELDSYLVQRLDGGMGAGPLKSEPWTTLRTFDCKSAAMDFLEELRKQKEKSKVVYETEF